MKALLIILGTVTTIAASATALAFVGLPYRPLGVEFLQNGPYATLAISAEASGSTTPDQIPDADPDEILMNGDFQILRAAGQNTPLGDGVNEVTLSDFDFSSDPQFDSFPTSTPLASAVLTLTVTPRSLGFSNDTIAMGDLDDINPAIYDQLPQDTTSTIQIELLDFYSSEEILEELTSDSGQVTMAASDDAIVSFAELVLISEASSTELPAGSNLSGQVLLQGATVGDLSGIEVNLFGNSEVRTMRTVFTSPDGSFSIDLPPGSYEVMATRDGWQPQNVQITPSEDDLELEPMRLLLAGDGCPGAIPGDEGAPQIADVISVSNPANPQVVNLEVDLDQPGLVWAEYFPSGDPDNPVTTSLTEDSDVDHLLQLTQLQPDTPYCFQVFATSEEVSDPDQATQVSDSFPGSFITGPEPPESD